MEVYKIFVELAMASNAPRFLAALSSQLLGVNAKVKELEGGFNRLKLAIGGGLSIAAGAGLLSALNKIADKGAEILNQQNQLRRLGLAHNDIMALTANYYANVAKAVPTSDISEYLKTVKELRAVTGSLAEAQAFAPTALKFDALLSNVMGKQVHGELYRILRAGEMKGIATDPVKLRELITQAYSYIASFGGKLTASMIQNLAVRGGTAWMNANLKESFGPMAVLAAEMGASGGGGNSSPGVVLYQLQQLMMGANTMSKQQTQIFSKLGLLDMSKIQWTGFGHSRAQLLPGAIKGSLEYAGNVPGWAKNVVWPALVRASTVNGKVDESLLQLYLAKIAPTTNKAKAIELFGNPEFLKQQMKDLGIAKMNLPLGSSYSSFINKNPMGVEEAYAAQYNTMLATLGKSIQPIKMDTLKGLTSFFQSISALSQAHPEALKNIAEGLVILGGALVGAGIAAVVAAIGTGGWIVAGLLALGGAAVAYGPKIKDFLFHMSALLNQIVGEIAKEISSWPARLMSAISGMGSAIVDAIRSAISHVTGGWLFGGSSPTSHPAATPLQKHSMLHIGAPPRHLAMTHSPVNIYLDGEKVGEANLRHMVASARFPNAIGGVDTYGSWTSPGTGLIDAA